MDEVDMHRFKWSFCHVPEATIRLCWNKIKEISDQNPAWQPMKVAVVCGINDALYTKYNHLGKTMELIKSDLSALELAEKMTKSVGLFEQKVADLWGDVQVVWVVPHPVDIETYLQTHMFNSKYSLSPSDVKSARNLTKYLNQLFQVWEGTLRQNPFRCVFPWFLIFVSLVPDGSNQFVQFMKSVRSAAPMTNISALLPVATCDGIRPTKKSVMQLLQSLNNLTRSQQKKRFHGKNDGNVSRMPNNRNSSRLNQAKVAYVPVTESIDQSNVDLSGSTESSIILDVKEMITPEMLVTPSLNDAGVLALHPPVSNIPVRPKEKVTVETDLPILMEGVKSLDVRTPVRTSSVMIDTQDDLLPELLILPCGHMKCVSGVRLASITCKCGQNFDLDKYSEAISHAKVVKFISKMDI